MIQTLDCAEARMSLGAYVLGALDPAERALVDAHLAACRDCRDELAGLAGLPALLARVGAEDAVRLAEQDEPVAGDEQPPPELLGSVLDLASARRRRRGWRNAGLGAAAALIVAAGTFGGVRLASQSTTSSPPPAAQNNYGPGGTWQTASAVSPDGQGATVSYRQMGWGTQLAVRVVGIPVGTTCRLWVVENDGARQMTGSWITDTNENTIWYPSSAAAPYPSIRDFQISVAGSKAPITVIPR